MSVTCKASSPRIWTSTGSYVNCWQRYEKFLLFAFLDVVTEFFLLVRQEDEAAAVSGASSSLPTSASFPETFMYNTRPPPYPVAYGHGAGVSASMQVSPLVLSTILFSNVVFLV